MKQKILLFALILSLGLNIALIVGRGYRHWKFYPGRLPAELNSQLRLSQVQKEKMRSLELENRKKIDPLRKEIETKSEELLALLKVSTSPGEEIRKKIEEISVLQCDLHKSMVEDMLEKRDILTPEQQEKFFSIITKRFGGRSSSPAGFPPVGESHPRFKTILRSSTTAKDGGSTAERGEPRHP